MKMKSTDSHWLAFFSMLIPPVLGLAATAYVLEIGGARARTVRISLENLTTSKSFLCEEPSAASACAQFVKAGWTYGGTWIVLLIVAPVITVLSTLIIARTLRKTRSRIIVAIVIVIVVALVAILTWKPSNLYDLTGNGAADDMPRQSVFDLVFSALHMSNLLNYSIMAASVFATVAAVVTAAACFATILDLPAAAPRSSKLLIGEASITPVPCARVAEMSNRLYTLRVLVTMGALLLVLGVFTTSGYLAWPSSFVKETDRGTFKQLADGILLIAGTEYSLLLFIGFLLPASVLFISGRSIAIASGAASHKQIETYLTQAGLNFSFPNILKDSLTVVAPFIASSLVSLAKLVP